MIDLQFWGMMLLLSLSAAYCLRRMWVAWLALKAGGCSSSCGCNQDNKAKAIETKQPGVVSVDDLTARLRSRSLIKQ